MPLVKSVRSAVRSALNSTHQKTGVVPSKQTPVSVWYVECFLCMYPLSSWDVVESVLAASFLLYPFSAWS